MNTKRLFALSPEKMLALIEQSARFTVDNLFKSDLAVWEQELQKYYPELSPKSE